ncbi:hypothetical protein ACFFQW_43840 [Umezawaea endophytica]|uniref:Excalibur calcium-binding domain-containing protein n=1 Tax=Umezawaea endophytica TaxID=1654476 RepID=A0A9X3AIG1_9PSEU|nr:hypothetical protein [Umezawaea endophytica]MCS7483092.1 hypothetical protein [Umezawaea endophytica]
MISGRRRVLAVAGTALIGGALIGTLLLSGGPKPVDVRQVQSSFGPEPVLSATYTTSVLGVGPTTTPPPAPAPPPPPVESTQTRTAERTPPSSPTKRTDPPRHLPPWLEDLGGCDDDYDTDGVCVPWLLPILADQCDWLHEHGSRHIEVHGEDRHALDHNQDGIACGTGDR